MSVRDLIWNAIQVYEQTGASVDFIILTPNFFRKLNAELGGTEKKWAKELKKHESGGVTYLDRVLIIADIPLIAPVHVALSPENMMLLYSGKVKED